MVAKIGCFPLNFRIQWGFVSQRKPLLYYKRSSDVNVLKVLIATSMGRDTRAVFYWTDTDITRSWSNKYSLTVHHFKGILEYYQVKRRVNKLNVWQDRTMSDVRCQAWNVKCQTFCFWKVQSPTKRATTRSNSFCTRLNQAFRQQYIPEESRFCPFYFLGIKFIVITRRMFSQHSSGGRVVKEGGKN